MQQRARRGVPAPARRTRLTTRTAAQSALKSTRGDDSMTRVRTAWMTFWSQDDGAALVEYGILVALIAVVCFVAVQTLGQSVRDNLFGVSNGIIGGS
jgi:Flp pilus assembly pilin Flp